MINASDRRQAVKPLKEAADSGAHCIKHVQSLESVSEHITAGRIQTVII